VFQFAIGAFDFTILRWPVNIVLSGVIILSLLLFSTKRKSFFYQWFSGVPMAVTLVSAIVILGITGMPSAWPFVFVYFLILLSLGAVIIRRMIPFRIKNYAFYLNHIGLWLFLFAAGMGASDIRTYVMYVQEGETEWRAYNENDDILDLPVGIKLNDFYMEEYPPQQIVIDGKTVMTRPEPKRFVSDIDVYAEDGSHGHALLEVNKPYKMGHWMLYQYGYDNEAGNLSAYSVIELVYDPWVTPVYIGIILLACGSVCMLWSGNKRKEASDDVE
jgi:cytochrome c biogenesis factor